MLFVRFTTDTIMESEEVSPDLIVDYDAEAHIVGIEILNTKARLGAAFSASDVAG